MKKNTLVSLALIASLGSGCWSTGVSARGAQLEGAGEEAVHSSRGVYLLGGAIHLTGGEAMAECPAGIARAESEMTLADWGLSLGLGALAYLVTSQVVCEGTSAECQAMGLSAAAGMQALVGTRTLRWRCARGHGAPSLAPAALPRVTASR